MSIPQKISIALMIVVSIPLELVLLTSGSLCFKDVIMGYGGSFSKRCLAISFLFILISVYFNFNAIRMFRMGWSGNRWYLTLASFVFLNMFYIVLYFYYQFASLFSG